MRKIKKYLSPSGSLPRRRLKFTPEQVALFESSFLNKGTNNSGGQKLKEEGVLALQHLELKKREEEARIRSRSERPHVLKKRKATLGGKDEYELTTQVVGMSGRDPLLGTIFDLYIGGKGAESLFKSGSWLYNNGKIILKSIPYNSENFYRAVGKDAIKDAQKSGIIRSSSKEYLYNPYFSHGRLFWTGERVIEGKQGPVLWVKAKGPNGEYSLDDVIKPGEKNLSSGHVPTEVFPYSNGSTQVSTKGFSYWKKHPIVGWREYKFKQGGKMNKIKKYLNPSGPLVKIDGEWVPLVSDGAGNLYAVNKKGKRKDFKVNTKPKSATGSKRIVVTPKDNTIVDEKDLKPKPVGYSSAFQGNLIMAPVRKGFELLGKGLYTGAQALERGFTYGGLPNTFGMYSPERSKLLMNAPTPVTDATFKYVLPYTMPSKLIFGWARTGYAPHREENTGLGDEDLNLMFDVASAPVVFKGIKSTPKTLNSGLEVASDLGSKTAKNWRLAREINLGIKLNTKNGYIEVPYSYFEDPNSAYRATTTREVRDLGEVGHTRLASESKLADADYTQGMLGWLKGTNYMKEVENSDNVFTKAKHRNLLTKDGVILETRGTGRQFRKGYHGHSGELLKFEDIDISVPKLTYDRMFGWGYKHDHGFSLSPFTFKGIGLKTGDPTIPALEISWFTRSKTPGRWVYNGEVIPEERIIYEPTKPKDFSTSLKFFERKPARKPLSVAESLGISKGDRGNLSLTQRQAIEDLALYRNSGQYRQVFRVTPDWEDFGWNLSRDNPTFMLQFAADGETMRGPWARVVLQTPTGKGVVAWNPERNMGGYSSRMFKLPLELKYSPGEANMIIEGPNHKVILTSPRVDIQDFMYDLANGTIEELNLFKSLDSQLKRTIDKDVMKDFWVNSRKVQRPGSYMSGDNGRAPLGSTLIEAFKKKQLHKTPILERPIDLQIVRRTGLSPDSYSSIIRLGNRDGSLRWGEGFTNWNNSAIENKFVSDALKLLKNGKITPEQYEKIFNEWSLSIGGRPLLWTIVKGLKIPVHPHPYIYAKKQGGKMNTLLFLKNGSGIHIKKKNRGKFTDYCGGKVTDECIRRAKASGNPTLVKRATFADNARHWKHKEGGKAFVEGVNVLDSNPKAYKYVKKKYKMRMALDGTKFDWASTLGNVGSSILQGYFLNKKISREAEAAKAMNKLTSLDLFNIYNLKLQEAKQLEELLAEAIKAMTGTIINPSNIVAASTAYKNASGEYAALKNNVDLQNRAIDAQAQALKSNIWGDAISGVMLQGVGLLGNYLNNKKSSNITTGITTPSITAPSYNYFSAPKKFGTFNNDGSMNLGYNMTYSTDKGIQTKKWSDDIFNKSYTDYLK